MVFIVLQVEYKRTEILQHPVIRSFLLQKWKKFGFYYYLFTMLTYGLFLFLLTAFSMISNNPLGDVCKCAILMCDSSYIIPSRVSLILIKEYIISFYPGRALSTLVSGG